MLTKEENERITRVGRGTPMGNLLRRYWIPAARSADVQSGGRPQRVRLLGDDYVLFRDRAGRPGLVDESCPHRGASLALARNEGGESPEDCGLRCLYHGWKVAADGHLVDTPTEPEGSRYKERLRHVTYPTVESAGFIWTHFGPEEQRPELPTFAWTDAPDSAVNILMAHEECNWLQSLENLVDSAHINFLHSDNIIPTDGKDNPDGQTRFTEGDTGRLYRPSSDGRPKLSVDNTDYGFRYAAIRRPVVDPETRAYIRISHFIMPIFGTFPAPVGWGHMQMTVPVDDENCIFYFVQHRLDKGEISEESRARKAENAGLGPEAFDEHGRRRRNRDNMWLQDAEAMEGDSFSGIVGISAQDLAVQESMGRIYDRSKEHVGATDVAVIRLRRLFMEAMDAVEAGGVPRGLTTRSDVHGLLGSEGVIGVDDDWHRLLSEEAPA